MNRCKINIFLLLHQVWIIVYGYVITITLVETTLCSFLRKLFFLICLGYLASWHLLLSCWDRFLVTLMNWLWQIPNRGNTHHGRGFMINRNTIKWINEGVFLCLFSFFLIGAISLIHSPRIHGHATFAAGVSLFTLIWFHSLLLSLYTWYLMMSTFLYVCKALLVLLRVQ